MAFPGLATTPVNDSGIPVPTPEYSDAYWLSIITEPVDPEFIVYGDQPITVRTIPEEGGRASCSIVVNENATPGLQVELVAEGVWDVVLVDSFEDDLCPNTNPLDALSSSERVFFGDEQGRVIRLNKGNEELGTAIPGFLRPNVIAPAGIGATCLFRNVYVAVEATTGGLIVVTPVLDGEVLTEEATTFAVPSDGLTRTLKRFEVGLSRKYEVGGTEVSRAGLVGTWFTVEVDVVDAFGCGRIQVGGLEVEYSPHEEGVPGPTFTGESSVASIPIDSKAWYFAGNGSGLYRGAQGTDDAGTPILVRFQTNEVAPAGAGGECLFEYVELAITRFNAVDWSFTVTPIIDGVELVGEEVTLVGVPDPVTELVEVSFSQPYMVEGVERSRYTPRGAWCALLITATSAPDRDVFMDGATLEFEIVVESEEEITNA